MSPTITVGEIPARRHSLLCEPLPECPATSKRIVGSIDNSVIRLRAGLRNWLGDPVISVSDSLSSDYNVTPDADQSPNKEAFALWWIFRQGKARIGDQFAWSKLEQLC